MNGLATIETCGVNVATTVGRGFSAEEVAEMLLNKIIHVSDKAPEPIKAQALAYKNQLRPMIVHYMKMAIQCDRTSIFNELHRAGYPELAEGIRRL